jgi:hypothetical protein
VTLVLKVHRVLLVHKELKALQERRVPTVLLVLKELKERKELKVHKVQRALKVLKVQQPSGTLQVLTVAEMRMQLEM